jgi:hypothetical protein
MRHQSQFQKNGLTPIWSDAHDIQRANATALPTGLSGQTETGKGPQSARTRSSGQQKTIENIGLYRHQPARKKVINSLEKMAGRRANHCFPRQDCIGQCLEKEQWN